MNLVIRVGLLGSRYVTIGPTYVDLEALTLVDVARGLGRIPRFAGQTPWPYSVARHSVILADWLAARGRPTYLQRQALLHDGPEALGVSDINTFVKRGYGTEIRGLEDRLMTELHWRFIGPPHPFGLEQEIHDADRRLGNCEAVYFGWAVDGHVPHPDDPNFGWEFRASRLALDDAAEWLARWEELK